LYTAYRCTIHVFEIIVKLVKGISIINVFELVLSEFEKKEVKPNLYSYREVKLATSNFHKDNKLGEGGFGEVFKVQYMIEFPF